MRAWKITVVLVGLVAALALAQGPFLYSKSQDANQKALSTARAQQHLLCHLGKLTAAAPLVRLPGETGSNYLLRLETRGAFLIGFRHQRCAPPPSRALIAHRIRQLRHILAVNGRHVPTRHRRHGGRRHASSPTSSTSTTSSSIAPSTVPVAPPTTSSPAPTHTVTPPPTPSHSGGGGGAPPPSGGGGNGGGGNGGGNGGGHGGGGGGTPPVSICVANPTLPACVKVHLPGAGGVLPGG